MSIINIIKDALDKDSSTRIPCYSIKDPGGNDGCFINVPVPTQKSEEIMAKTTSSTSHWFETGGDNTSTKPKEQPDSSISTQAKTSPAEGQATNSNIPQAMYQPLDIKAVTSQLNDRNRYISAVEKYQENFLQDQDRLQIQKIQNELMYRQPIPITDNVSVKVEPPLDAFPSQWQALMNSISCFLNVPVSTLFSALLAAVYTAVCGKFKIEVRKDYFETCTEYFIAVMPSGFNKSGIVKTFRNPLDKYIEKLQVEFDKQAHSQKMAMKLFKQVEKKLLKTFAKQAEGKDGAEIDLMLKDIEVTMAPLKKKLREGASRPTLFNDAPTMKKLAENMRDQNEFMAIYEAEGAIWKDRVIANKNSILLKGFTGEYFGNETATNGSVVMQNPCLLFCSYIQPGVAAELYSNEDFKDDGLLPRILPFFCLSKPAIQSAIPQNIDPELMAMYEHKISSILDYCWEERRVNRKIETLQMSDDARQEYLNFSQKVTIQTHEGRFNSCKAFASKLAGHAIRLAGAIHFLEHDKPWEKPIGSSAMRAGIALAEFYAEHAIFAFDKKQNDSFVYARKIIKWIKGKRVHSFVPREAQNGIAHGSKIDQIEAGIDLLIKNNYLAPHYNCKGKMLCIVNQNTFRVED